MRVSWLNSVRQFGLFPSIAFCCCYAITYGLLALSAGPPIAMDVALSASIAAGLAVVALDSAIGISSTIHHKYWRAQLREIEQMVRSGLMPVGQGLELVIHAAQELAGTPSLPGPLGTSKQGNVTKEYLWLARHVIPQIPSPVPFSLDAYWRLLDELRSYLHSENRGPLTLLQRLGLRGRDLSARIVVRYQRAQPVPLQPKHLNMPSPAHLQAGELENQLQNLAQLPQRAQELRPDGPPPIPEQGA